MPGMKQRNRREEIRRLLARRVREGLTYRELSERTGINPGTLSWWARKLRREEGPAFAEVVVEDSAGDSTLELRVGAVSLRVARGFDPELLGRVLDVLERRC